MADCHRIAVVGAGIGGFAVLDALGSGEAARVLADWQALSAAFTPQYQSHSRALPLLCDQRPSPLSRLWPLPRILSALVSGDLIPPIAGSRFPDPEWTASASMLPFGEPKKDRA